MSIIPTEEEEVPVFYPDLLIIQALDLGDA